MVYGFFSCAIGSLRSLPKYAGLGCFRTGLRTQCAQDWPNKSSSGWTGVTHPLQSGLLAEGLNFTPLPAS